MVEKHYRRKFNTSDLKIILITLSTDKTELSKGSRRQAWPVYLTVMNFVAETLKLEETNVLIGFIPKLSYSDAKIKEFMSSSGITAKNDRKYSLTVLNRWLEAECMKAILSPILQANKNGPIKLLIDGKEYDTMPVFHTFTGKVSH